MPSDRESKSHHVTVRMSPEQTAFIDALGEAWGITKTDGSVNRSETLRLITEALNGILAGRFFAIVDTDALATEWGAVGQVLALAAEADGELPAAMREARLQDVLKPPPDLVGAARVETGAAVEVDRAPE